MWARAEPISDRVVVPTFNDGKRTDAEFLAPPLEGFGFGATFFLSEGLGVSEKDYFLTWEEVRELHGRGFEIGNRTRSHPDHTRSHPDVSKLDRGRLIA